MAVPWCFKVIYGFLSDCLPINGQRRKPYFIIGWLVFIASNLLLAATPSPSIQLCICLVFAQTAGYMLSDVMTDALIVERSRYETQEERGQMQSQGYIVRFFGSTIGAAVGAVVYNKGDWEWYLPINVVFFINAAFPIFMLLPFVPYLLELDTHCHAKNFQQQCFDLFCTAQLRAVWQPMTFVYIYNALQLTNAAWMNFLLEGLGFMAWQIGIVSIAGSIFSWLGILTYEKFFFAANWRIVYFWCTTLATIIALGQLVLVFGWNRSIGIPDIWFSMGDDVLVEFVIAVQFLPVRNECSVSWLGLVDRLHASIAVNPGFIRLTERRIHVVNISMPDVLRTSRSYRAVILSDIDSYSFHLTKALYPCHLVDRCASCTLVSVQKDPKERHMPCSLLLVTWLVPWHLIFRLP